MNFSILPGIGSVRTENHSVNLQLAMKNPLPLQNSAFSKAKILVVEDEEDIQLMLRYNLEREGYQVSVAETGEQALESVKANAPDLVLLDLMLPGVDGLEVCRQIRQLPEAAHVRIVMVTAKVEDVDVVVGLESGADDYITKPFSPRILLARIKTALRKRQAEREASGGMLRFGDLMILPDQHRVKIGSEQIDLTVTEFRILFLLAQRPGWVFTREQIVDTARGDFASVAMRSVDVHIVRLRSKLGMYGDCIETVRSMGYRFRKDAEAEAK